MTKEDAESSRFRLTPGPCPRNTGERGVAMYYLSKLFGHPLFGGVLKPTPITPSRETATMSPTLQSLGIDRLSLDQRVVLAEEIWESIALEAERLPLTEAQKQDLQRRLAVYEANRRAGSTWEQVKTRLRES